MYVYYKTHFINLTTKEKPKQDSNKYPSFFYVCKFQFLKQKPHFGRFLRKLKSISLIKEER